MEDHAWVAGLRTGSAQVFLNPPRVRVPQARRRVERDAGSGRADFRKNRRDASDRDSERDRLCHRVRRAQPVFRPGLGRTWWRNPGLATDICYILIIPFAAPYMRMSLMIGGAALLSGVMTTQEIKDYFEHGRGPLAGLPFWAQLPIYVVVSDFLLYWIHRLFHGARLWRFHAVHHSAEEVDWTTAYRFHPVNLWLGSFLVTALMLFLGISPTVLLFPVAFDTTTAAFVHANLNWTLGPLKYVVATPVFHRWHHTPLDQGGNSNFGSLFSLRDVLFGTFHMPAHALPDHYGIDDPQLDV